MKKCFSLIVILLLIICNVFSLSTEAEDGKFLCKYKTYTREFILCLPEDFESKTQEEKNAVSLILMLHGAGGTAESFMAQTEFHKSACARNYAVAYVTGTVKKNDKSSPIGWQYFNDRQSKDDVRFLMELSKHLVGEYELSSKVFVAGFSNGAFMVTKLASQNPGFFTAVASVGGMMPSVVWEKRSSQPSAGFLQVNGTKDDVVPMQLNESVKYSPNPAMEDVLEYFAGTANYIEEKRTKRVVQRNYGDKVRWLIIDEGHHSWPEKSISTIDCNTEILNFFDEMLGRPVVKIPFEPEQLQIFREAYPDVSFEPEYDEENADWKITLTIGQRKVVLYWNNGSMIPSEELPNKEKYWTLLYGYEYKTPLIDPATYTEDEIASIKKFTTAENRRNGAGTPMFFFDAVYDSYTRASLEKHIKTVRFLGFGVNVHERLIEPLARVNKRIMEAAETDAEIQSFLKSINRNEGYYWRLIANTNRKSFHSLGIALDITPKSYGGKEVFWSWAKDKNPDRWMFTPLNWRWMPPQKVIDIFEEEGFIWGGKWVVWDNMHFEYHPELILQSQNK